MKLRWLLGLLCGLLALMVGARAHASFVTCADYGMNNAPKFPARIVLNGFSVAAPAEGNWCTQGANALETTIVLYKNINSKNDQIRN